MKDDDEQERITQEDIDEGLIVDERANLRFTRQTFLGGESIEDVYYDDGFIAVYNREEIARSTTWKGLFRKLTEQSLALGSPRVFQVNDHGNVTEFNYSGREIGSQV